MELPTDPGRIDLRKGRNVRGNNRRACGLHFEAGITIGFREAGKQSHMALGHEAQHLRIGESRQTVYPVFIVCDKAPTPGVFLRSEPGYGGYVGKIGDDGQSKMRKIPACGMARAQ